MIARCERSTSASCPVSTAPDPTLEPATAIGGLPGWGRPKSRRPTAVRANARRSVQTAPCRCSSHPSLLSPGRQKSSRSIYYRNGAFRHVLGRFGRTPGSAKTPQNTGFSCVLAESREIAYSLSKAVLSATQPPLLIAQTAREGPTPTLPEYSMLTLRARVHAFPPLRHPGRAKQRLGLQGLSCDPNGLVHDFPLG
jgi:hypothetical protein